MYKVAFGKCTTKQQRNNQAKIHISITLNYKNIIKALKEKNVNYHAYRFKKDKNYKVVLKSIHSKINMNDN